MKIKPTALLTRQLLPSFSLLTLAFLPQAVAQSIPNPSFEENNPFTTWPGYSHNNEDIIGWVGNPASNVGINPAADPNRDLAGNSPFANNGTIPDGARVALIQSMADHPTSLSTTITGLTAGQKYLLTFRANARNNNNNRPRLHVEVDGNELLNSRIMNVAAAGAAAPYRYIALEFTATGTTADLVLYNDEPVDATVLVDDFAVRPAPGKWTYEEWFDDATSGVESSYASAYTHAYNLGTDINAYVNDVEFVAVPGPNPSVPGRFTITGMGNVYSPDDLNNVSESSADLAARFIYGGNPGTLTLEGLVPGTEYILSLYTVAWEDATNRWVTFRAGDDELSIDQDAFGNDNGMRIDYRYVADETGTLTVTTNPFTADGTPNVCTFHLYAFANRLATLPTSPAIAQQPISGRYTVGDEVTLSVTASGSQPLAYQWKRNGENIPGATSATLTFTVSSGADAGLYTVVVSNSQGSLESNPALIEAWQPIGALPSTGVDESGYALPEEEVDPHYTLLENPNDPGSTDTWVHSPNPAAWLPNSETSQWIAPAVNTVDAAGPDPTIYVYSLPFTLPQGTSQIMISGLWGVDNLGSLRINGVPAPNGPTNSGFSSLLPFNVVTTDFPAGTLREGTNSLEFVVVNQAVGYTALRTDEIIISTVPPGARPIITRQPEASQTVLTGNPVTLMARVYGSEPLTYQWSLNGQPITGATSSSLTIESVSATDVGTYTLTVTNAHGSDTSTGATISIIDSPPSIVTQPQGGYFPTGTPINLTIEVTGSRPFTYQWTKDGQPVGGNSATLTLPGTPADSGIYMVQVTNSESTVTSSSAEVIVMDPVPGFHNTGDGLSAGEEDPHYTLIVNADGDAPIPAIVQSGLPGAWLPNSNNSRWIGPRENTVDAAGYLDGESDATYIYRTTIDLTGFDPQSTILMGQWATDNQGLAILVNEKDTGLTNNAQFAAWTDFFIDSGNAEFVAGVNTIDFVVLNPDANVGYTGLRIQNARAFSLALSAPPLAVSNLNISLNAQSQPVLTFNGQANASYDIERSTTLATGSWSKIGSATADAQGAATFTDTTPPTSNTIFYRVTSPAN